MGNRAVITTAPFSEDNIGIYVHWNGGQESIEGFLAACRELGYRCPTSDSYGWARLCQAIGNFFGGETSVGIDVCRNLDCDNYDNGVWFIGSDWTLAGRNRSGPGEIKPVGENPEPEKSKLIAEEIVRKTRAAEASKE